MGRLGLLSPDPAFEKALLAASPELGAHDISRWQAEYSHLDSSKVAARMCDEGVDVVCIGPGLPAGDLIPWAEAFDQEGHGVFVIVVAEPTPALWREALRAGARDLVSPVGAMAELECALARGFETAKRWRQSLDDAAPPGRGSRVITVLSPKGGAGKTVVATNLAVGLATALPGQVAIVDLDVQFGDVAAALQLAPRQGLGSIATSPEAVTATMVKVFLTSHRSGLFALCAPDSPAEGDAVTHEHGAQAVRLLASEFPIVVVDTGAGLQEHALAAIELSTDLVLVCTTDVTSVRSLRKALDALDKLGMTSQRRHFVLNRSDARVGLDIGDIEDAVGMKAELMLPSSRAVPVSMNQGSSVIESDPRSAVARQLHRLVDQFSGEHLDKSGARPAMPTGLFRRSGR